MLRLKASLLILRTFFKIPLEELKVFSRNEIYLKMKITVSPAVLKSALFKNHFRFIFLAINIYTLTSHFFKFETYLECKEVWQKFGWMYTFFKK